MIKVSIIVPVHNSAGYLHKCMDSLLAQTLPEIEILPVDDCSADNSPALIAAYAEQHPDKVVPLYLTENLRQGGARNRAMEIARGEYIAFVDSDDFIEPDMCKVLYEAADGADLCGSDYWIDRNGALTEVNLTYGEGRTMTDTRRAQYLGNCGYFWSRIYRKEFLEEFGLKFPEKTFYEDSFFNFLTALYARTAVKAPGRFYHYYQDPNSTMHSRNKPHQYERMAIPGLILAACRERGIYVHHRALIDRKYLSMQMSANCYTCLDQFDRPDRRQLARLRDLVKAECPHWRKIPYYKEAPLRLRFYFRTTMLWPRLTVLCHKADRFIELLGVLEGKLKKSAKR